MGFNYYKKLTIKTGQCPSSQSSFPVLLPFLAADNDFRTTGNGGQATSSSGFDIRPYSDALLTNALTFQLVWYKATTGQFEMWVNITAQDGGIIYLAVGNSSLTTDGSSSSTWNSHFISVYHMGDGTTLNINDSTSNANNLTNNNTATAGTGQIGGAVSLAQASSQFLSLASLVESTAVTVSAWIKATSLPDSYNTIFGWNNITNAYVRSDGKTAFYVSATTTIAVDPATTALSTATWYHLVFKYDSTNGIVIYVNAVSDGTASANGDLGATAEMNIGDDPATAGRDWNGLIDEARIYNIAVSADWVTTEYHNQSNLSNFWSKALLSTTDPLMGAINV